MEFQSSCTYTMECNIRTYSIQKCKVCWACTLPQIDLQLFYPPPPSPRPSILSSLFTEQAGSGDNVSRSYWKKCSVRTLARALNIQTGVPHFLQANARMISKTRPRPLSSSSLYTIIQTFDDICSLRVTNIVINLAIKFLCLIFLRALIISFSSFSFFLLLFLTFFILSFYIFSPFYPFSSSKQVR